MVVIRLTRGGARKAPFYQVVVADSRKANGCRFIERVGYYNPMARGLETRLELNQERIGHWVDRGAIPSDRVSHLVKWAKKGAAVNEPAPKRMAVRAAQIVTSEKAEKIKAKAAAEAAAQAEHEAKSSEANSEAESQKLGTTDSADDKNQ